MCVCDGVSQGGMGRTSMGSTSCEMTTSLAFFCSTSVVTWLMPNLTSLGLGPRSASLPSTWALASSRRRSFLAALVSGRYLDSSLKSVVAAHTHAHTQARHRTHTHKHAEPSDPKAQRRARTDGCGRGVARARRWVGGKRGEGHRVEVLGVIAVFRHGARAAKWGSEQGVHTAARACTKQSMPKAPLKAATPPAPPHGSPSKERGEEGGRGRGVGCREEAGR